MYQYTDFDKQFVKQRAAQYRDQLERNLAGKLADDEFRPLRLQNGWYVQRYAPMLRVAVPYGEMSSAQLRVLAKIAAEYDQPSNDVFKTAVDGQAKLSGKGVALTKGYGHFTTRQNVQFNWIPLDKSADVMDLLASVNMHGIQTSGARFTQSLHFCRVSLSLLSQGPKKTAPLQLGTMWVCTWFALPRLTQAKVLLRVISASKCWSVAAWAAPPSWPPRCVSFCHGTKF
jgi:Nitrite/Sulfite reductase ferredoxin-like half domain